MHVESDGRKCTNLITVQNSVVVDSLFTGAPIVCGCFVFGPCFEMEYLGSFLVLQSSHPGKENWLLYFKHVTVSVLCLFLTVPWVGLQYVMLSFPGYTHLLFHMLHILLHRLPLKIQDKYRY